MPIKICLCMIVKNESAIIRRCMDSCRSIIDAISICDTGSPDNTVEVINQYAKEHQLPCNVPVYPWKNFGFNRTHSAIEGRSFVNRLGWNPAETYLLLLDADMKLEIASDFTKDMLKVGGYRLVQRNNLIKYENTRLIRCDYEWKCVGVTHEYWDSPRGCITESFHKLEIDDLNDGGCKADKFERDIRLLTQGLIDEPKNGRYMFYLAQSYKCINQHEKAIEWYKKRIEAGGWDEEIWYSHMAIGESWQALKNDAEMIFWFLKAYNVRPKRAEPLYKLAHYYRVKGMNSAGVLFAKAALEIPYPSGDLLFISHHVYEYEALFEFSICGYYTKEKPEGFKACEKLLFMPTVEGGVRNQSHRNLFFYLEPLPNVQFFDYTPKLKLPLLIESDGPNSDTYRPMNPSILKHDTGYYINFRTVNYKHEGGHYSYRDGSGQIKTKNIIVETTRALDSNEFIVKQYSVIDNIGGEIQSNINGLEDLRIFEFRGGLWALAGNRISVNVPQIVLCELNMPAEQNEITFKRKILLIPPKGECNCEKNWMPYVVDDELYVVYSHQPLVVLKVEIDKIVYSNKVVKYVCPVHKSVKLPYNLDLLRGSARPVSFEDGYLSVVHEVMVPDKTRVYSHRFVYYNKEMVPIQTSRAFYFKQKAIEYVAGMELSHDQQHIVMGVGFNDEKAAICSVPVATVKSMLHAFC